MWRKNYYYHILIMSVYSSMVAKKNGDNNTRASPIIANAKWTVHF